jgi:hypothetical protein
MRHPRVSIAVLLLAAAVGCSGSGDSGSSTGPARTGPLGSPPEPTPPPPSLSQPPPPTRVVVLAFLTPSDSLVQLSDGVETLVQQYEIYAPCHEKFGGMPVVRPVVGCPLPYTVWETELDVAPMTVENTGSVPATLTVTTYSDNAYVYQQQQTIQPGSRSTVTLGSMQLGFICSDGGPSMPISISMHANGADMVLIRSTGVPATLRRPYVDDFPSVWGAAVLLYPLDGEQRLCG